jgi:hypothetical protein
MLRYFNKKAVTGVKRDGSSCIFRIKQSKNVKFLGLLDPEGKDIERR